MLREWLTRLRFLMSPKPNREIDDELRFHIERQAQEYIAAGMTPQEARRNAVVSFGGIESVRAQSHEQRPSFFLGTFFKTSITRPGSSERPRLHRDCRLDPRPRHRSQRCHFHSDQRRPAQKFARR
jgi:hypothetical protein